MDGGRTQLRDRMLRDAIIEVLRAAFNAPGQGDAISLVDAGSIRQVIVTGDRVRVDLALPTGWSPYAGTLIAEVQRRIQALPEVTVTEIIVTPTQPGVAPPEDPRCSKNRLSRPSC